MSDRSSLRSATRGTRRRHGRRTRHRTTTFSVILALSFCHLLNDMMQSLVPALYPILKSSYGLSFSQVGLITLAFQVHRLHAATLVGLYTDRHPRPYSLTAGISLTLVGLLLMSRASRIPRSCSPPC
jgi:FSR family fosmidomycin resistance protein-like MFS transporter